MPSVLNTIVVGVASYLALVVLLRVSGKRTLSKWNAFDFVATIALGSTLATALTSADVSLTQGITAFLVIIGLQFAMTFTSVRSTRFKNLIKSTPTLLLHEGRYLENALQRERVAEAEVRAAIRAKGVADIDQVYAVVLETDGSFSVILERGTSNSALDGVTRNARSLS
ncbi:DUF421 domain-containing protein [Larsenimonas suaedae]|uniref:DUF421 domain-containing protein n=1 Tax=Larsenimonas suaedae TaxID=1851019 RepID=A0ABU1GSH7_9GAMM|nr:YetF domain-containing protein [Larsenimonas suaedae]MCM2972241.1 DUF421 domain-containing protein [Larsenimonas suaedae]MDR5894963.1 DUF421 domain-containing protein [Larsenimonas suaedae]